MKKLLTLFGLMWCIVSNSQTPIYERNHFAQAGQSYTVVFADTLNVTLPYDVIFDGYTYSPEFPDQMQIWDFSYLTPTDSEIVHFGLPSESPYKGYWCDEHNEIDEIEDCETEFSTRFNQWRNVEFNYHLDQFEISDAIEHSMVTNDGIEVKMFGVKVNGYEVVLDYDDSDIILHFPLNYGDTFTDTSSCSGTFTNPISPFPIPLVYNLNFNATRNYYVDGYGSLSLPNGGSIHNVLRVTTTYDFTVSIESYIGIEVSHYNYKVFQQAFYSESYGFPVLVVEYQFDEGQLEVGYVHYIDGILSTKDHTQIINTIYPNPTTGIFNVEGKIKVYNTLGQFITDKPDLSPFANGVYFVQFENGSTARVIKK